MKSQTNAKLAGVLVLAASWLGGCTQDPWDQEINDLQKIMVAVSWAGHGVTPAKRRAAAASSEAERQMLKKVLIDPIANAGYDPDRLIQRLVVIYQAENISEDDAARVGNFLQEYSYSTGDLRRFNLISSSTAAYLDRFQVRSAE